ncbi:hypothetical protein [Schaalia sp. lx-100]|uniref:hypothetical protein n=1 Tax=Schaalia sp. lx-100 TaxID=2899081 RepID=UPI001E5E910A|nr:hypothetical protein [Schaalia sp. lx-100]MCD4557916.1 hypothetical protein [Schaalia sp. lx-100]
MSTLSLPLTSAAVRDFVAENPQALKDAAAAAGTVFAWYSMPDFVRSRSLRFIAKTAVLATQVVVAQRSVANQTCADPWLEDVEEEHVPDTPTDSSDVLQTEHSDSETSHECGCSHDQSVCCSQDLPEDFMSQVKENPLPFIAAGLALTGASIAASVAGEKWLFRRAERRRFSGKKLAHTAQALPLALLTGACSLAANAFLSNCAYDQD